MDYLTRTQSLETGIFGGLVCGTLQLYTLEHAYAFQPDGPQYPVIYQPKIPPGVYTCKRGVHHLPWKEGVELGVILEDLGAKIVTIDGKLYVEFETFEITNVPGHTNCLFHWGNYNKDVDGCVALGIDRMGEMITSSRLAFEQFMEAKEGIDQFELTIK